MKSTFHGIPIVTTLPSEDGAVCILLLDPESKNDAVFENLLCIGSNDTILWKAALPTSPDAFTAVALTPEGLAASTWSGWQLLLDRHTGKQLARTFAK